MRDQETLEQQLHRVLKAHGLLCGALINASGEIITRVGDFGALQYGSLVSSLLGPLGSPKATFDYLEGQMLPKTHAQGEDFAFLDKPSPNLLVIVFGSGRQDTLQKLRHGKAVSRTIALEFAAGTE